MIFATQSFEDRKRQKHLWMLSYLLSNAYNPIIAHIFHTWGIEYLYTTRWSKSKEPSIVRASQPSDYTFVDNKYCNHQKLNSHALEALVVDFARLRMRLQWRSSIQASHNRLLSRTIGTELKLHCTWTAIGNSTGHHCIRLVVLTGVHFSANTTIFIAPHSGRIRLVCYVGLRCWVLPLHSSLNRCRSVWWC